MEQRCTGSEPLQLVRQALDDVLLELDALGRDDGPFLQHVIAALLSAARDLLRPGVALLTAHLLGQEHDPRVIRFAAALQIVYAASLAHRRTVMQPGDRANDHLTVLAGDYLYAQAAVLTAGLDHLGIMALLAATIKWTCEQAMLGQVTPEEAPHVSTRMECSYGPNAAGLFQLGAVGTALLLHGESPPIERLAAYGHLLDDIADRRLAQDDRSGLALRAAGMLEGLPDGSARRALVDLVFDPALGPVLDSGAGAPVAGASDSP